MAEHHTETKSNFSGRIDATVPFRRRTILAMLLCLPAVLFLQLSNLARSFLSPVATKGKYGGLIDAGPLDQIPQAETPPKLITAGRFWLVHDNSGIIALRHACTHLDCLFYYDENKEIFVCPCHGSEFSRDGQVRKGPANRPLDRFPIQLVTADNRQLMVSDMNTGAIAPIADLLNTKTVPDSSASVDSKQLIRLLVDTSIRITVS